MTRSTSSPRGARLPLEPLYAAIESTTGRPMHRPTGCRCGNESTSRACVRLPEAARLVGFSNRRLQVWRASGGIPLGSADRAAISLGWHPAVLWGQNWHDVDDDRD